ncbi:MAG: F0F1 ATP synthase subunit A [Propionibacteriaceae bacterium]|nr:F0F1 ATP synthase subunit A [Propionibacteriaceae bacterium]
MKRLVVPVGIVGVLVAIGWLLRPPAGHVPVEYESPGMHDFEFHDLAVIHFGNSSAFDFVINKPMLQLIISGILILAFFIPISRKLTIIPKKWQFCVEYIYDFVRSGIARTSIGHNYEKHVPFLVSIFVLVLMNNWFGEFFYFMFPTFANIGYTMGVVLVVWIAYIGAGIGEHGLKYFMVQLLPGGVPLWLAPLVMPLEFMSAFITRPLTLTIRLFGNMFAGHLGVLVFVVGGGWLVSESTSLLYNVAGFGSFALSLLIIAIELFIGFMQAYLFTLLSANYIASSVSHGH